MTHRRICVFCGSHAGHDPVYRGAAEELARVLVERDLGIVYGGGSVGLMGVLADTALAAGGEVYGVIPQALAKRELAHADLTELVVTPDMHTRKATMARLSDGFIALPGGYGTLDELFEIVTWCQLGLMHKPIALLDVDGYFEPLVRWIEHATAEGFVPAEDVALLRTSSDPRQLVDELLQRA
jgi:uncharacterized protein (TIGR00730 family)